MISTRLWSPFTAESVCKDTNKIFKSLLNAIEHFSYQITTEGEPNVCLSCETSPQETDTLSTFEIRVQMGAESFECGNNSGGWGLWCLYATGARRSFLSALSGSFCFLGFFRLSRLVRQQSELLSEGQERCSTDLFFQVGHYGFAISVHFIDLYYYSFNLF